MNFPWFNPSAASRTAVAKAARPLRLELLNTFLPVGLLPIVLAGGVSGFLTYRSTAQQAELRLNNLAMMAAELTAKELDAKMTLLSTVAANPLLLDAARTGTQQAEAENLQTLPIATVESRFAQTKLLKPNAELNQYLQNVALKGGFAELFFTERHGFNVASSRSTSDFVQRDEIWWQKGEQLRQWIGVPKFDPSSQTVAAEIVAAIVDPNSKDLLGVLKGGYDAANLAHVKTKLQNLELQGSEQLEIFARGSQLTRIITINAQGTRLSQASADQATIAEQVMRLRKSPAFEIMPKSSKIQTISWTEADRRYTLATVPGTNWLAISSVTLTQIQASARQVISLFGLFLLGLAGLTTWVILRFSRTLSAPLNHLALVAQQVTEKSDFTIQVANATEKDEVGLLATSFNQLLRRVQQLLAEQAEAQAQLETVNQTLEQKVQERTQELAVYSQTLEHRVQERTQELQEKTICLEKTLHQLQQTQSQMLQAEKMSSLGQLVAGIAHEINNPVNFIHGNLPHIDGYAQDLLDLLQLYEQELPNCSQQITDKTEEIDLEFLSEDLPKLLSSMRVGTDRIREIVQSLRTFSRLDEAEIKAADIHQGIDSTLMILQHRLKATATQTEVEVIKAYGELPLIECYSGALNQVFMNILANAIDALEESSRHRTLEQSADPSRITICTAVVNDQWVQISIADNGPGMPETIQQRIFDPFFTTKLVGKGTGMGMSISYQIITEKHGGKLDCLSTPGQGTEFVIQVPIQHH